jgi:hypothetical protein
MMGSFLSPQTYQPQPNQQQFFNQAAQQYQQFKGMVTEPGMMGGQFPEPPANDPQWHLARYYWLINQQPK